MLALCVGTIFAFDINVKGITKDYEVSDDVCITFPMIYFTEYADSYLPDTLVGAGSTFQLQDVKIDLFGGIGTELFGNWGLTPLVSSKVEYPFGRWVASVGIQYGFLHIEGKTGESDYSDKGVFVSQRLAYTFDKGLVVREVFDTDFKVNFCVSAIASHDLSFDEVDVYGTVGIRFDSTVSSGFGTTSIKTEVLPFCDFSIEKLNIIPDNDFISSNNLGAYVAYTDSGVFKVGAQIRTTVLDFLTLRFRLGYKYESNKSGFDFGVSF